MSYYTTLPFDSELCVNVNDELRVAVALDIPAEAFLEVIGWTDIPHTGAGLVTHPDHDFLWLTNWGIGLSGGYTIEYSWLEDETITQQMIDTHVSVMQAANAGSNVLFEYTDVDLAARTATARLFIPQDEALDWRESPNPWGLGASHAKYIFDGGQHYLCTTVLAANWQDWTSESKDIEPNGSLIIERVAGASSVYLIFSSDVTTSSGATLARGVTYSQTSPSLEVTAGGAGASVVRVSG
jgi:hypothetical protein